MPYRTKHNQYHTEDCSRRNSDWVRIEELPDIPAIDEKKQCECWTE